MLSEKMHIASVLNYFDLSTGDSAVADSINMKAYHKATFILQWHTIGGADIHLYVYSGATDAACTSALPFKYAFGSAAVGSASSDVLAALTASSGPVHITHGTYDDYIMVIEVDAKDMDLANNENWLTLALTDTDTGATGRVTGFVILEPRYMSDASPTALT